MRPLVTLCFILLSMSTLYAAEAPSQFLIGGSFGQFRADSSLDIEDLRNAYEGKIGFKEGLGILALSYDYIEEQNSLQPELTEQYSSVLFLLEGLTPPAKFIGPLQAQFVVGVHGGMIMGKVNKVEKQDFQYGVQGGINFPMASIFSIEIIYRYSFTNLSFDEVRIDNIQQLNVGAVLTF